MYKAVVSAAYSDPTNRFRFIMVTSPRGGLVINYSGDYFTMVIITVITIV